MLDIPILKVLLPFDTEQRIVSLPCSFHEQHHWDGEKRVFSSLVWYRQCRQPWGGCRCILGGLGYSSMFSQFEADLHYVGGFSWMFEFNDNVHLNFCEENASELLNQKRLLKRRYCTFKTFFNNLCFSGCLVLINLFDHQEIISRL